MEDNLLGSARAWQRGHGFGPPLLRGPPALDRRRTFLQIRGSGLRWRCIPFANLSWAGRAWTARLPSPPLSQQMELKDFAAHVAEKFKVHHIEPWSPVFSSTDANCLEQFRAAVERAHSSVVDIAVDQGQSQ
jgi:hypothetical protein